MRSIGQLPDAGRARVFHDFLVGEGISNEVEREIDGSWSVWIHDDDHLPAAQTWLARFNANPDDPGFRDAAVEAAKVREAEAQAIEDYRKRIRTRRSLFPKFGGYGIGFFTYALLAGCMLVFTYSLVGQNEQYSDLLRRLFITDPMTATGNRALPEVGAGEVWRLITPIFIHFGWVHLIFNLLMLFQLGCMIEGRQSSLRLAALVTVIAVLSNLAQYYVTGRPNFGGMSGVVYGLAGYVWIRGKYDRSSGLYLDSRTVTTLLVWLVICFTPIFSLAGVRIANWAHVAGLLAGMGWGWVSARFPSRKPD